MKRSCAKAVHERMLAEWNESEAHGEFRLFEHEYDIAIDQDDKKVLVGIVMRSLRNFFKQRHAGGGLRGGPRCLADDRGPRFLPSGRRARVSEDGPRLPQSQRDRSSSSTGRRVSARGSSPRCSSPATRSTLPRPAGSRSPEQLLTELAYLAIPRYVRRSVNRRSLDSARSFIEKSSRSMRELLVDPTENTARLEDFPMIDRPQVCRRCNFRRLCFPPGAQAAVPAAAQAASAPGVT